MRSFYILKKRLWLWILCFMVPSVAPMKCFFFTVALYMVFVYRHLFGRGHVILTLQLHWL